VLDDDMTTKFSTAATPAANAVEWWRGEFVNGKIDVAKVVITSDSSAGNVSKTSNSLKVMIDDKLCGETPVTTLPSIDYTVTCPAGTSGSKIKVYKAYNQKPLAFAQVKVYGFKCALKSMVSTIGLGDTYDKKMTGTKCTAGKSLGAVTSVA
jgi:hypothetical protein